MARPIWSGAISFGLVNVPVKLYPAVRSRSVSFHQISRTDQARIKQKRVSAASGEEVPYEDIVKGYEVSPGQYVLIEPEELEALDPESSRTIDIEDFVDLADIDPIYFDKPYYLGPTDVGGAKAYRLLVDAMEETGKVAIARFVMRTKQYLGAIRAQDGVLLLSTMNYADEIVPTQQIDGLDVLDGVEVRDRELTMAKQLVESLTSDFEPERYRDEHRERVLELIEAKAAGEEVTIPETPEPTRVVDLMAALEESLDAAKKRKKKRAS